MWAQIELIKSYYLARVITCLNCFSTLWELNPSPFLDLTKAWILQTYCVPYNYKWQNRKEYNGKMNWAPVPAQPPSPFTELLQTPPIGIRDRVQGWSGGAPEGVGEERGITFPSAKIFFIAAMILWDEDDIGTVLFYSVIYNSVLRTLCSVQYSMYYISPYYGENIFW